MSIITCKDWLSSKISNLFKKTDSIEYCQDNFKNKILINVFFEPSTRTSLSFECAMKKLGGNVINFQKDFSSLKKGESYHDTIKTLSNYGDIMVIRHPKEGYVSIASKIIDIPVINAGDGPGEHPTQALLDLYTIYKQFGQNFATKTILFIGDIKNSRTIHSLIILINIYPNMNIYLYPYRGLEPDEQLLENISSIHKQPRNDILLNESNLDFSKFDVVYITRLQKERLLTNETTLCNFQMTNELANKMKDDAIIMHPLPRNDEIHPEVDNNHRSHYFKQMKYGVNIRMALISDLLS